MLLVNTRREPSQDEVRSRLRAWVRYFMQDHEYDHGGFADAIHVSRPTITNILNDKRPMGLKAFLKMHFYLGAESGFTMERMVYQDPPIVGARTRPQAKNRARAAAENT